MTDKINLVKGKRDEVVFTIWMEGNKLKARHTTRTSNGGSISEELDITPLWNFFKSVQELKANPTE